MDKQGLTKLIGEIDKVTSEINLESMQKELSELKTLSQQSDFWQDNKRAANTTRRISELDGNIQAWTSLKSSAQDLLQLLDLEDETLKAELENQFQELTSTLAKLKNRSLLSGPYDKHDAVLSIQAGAGGRDAQDWAAMLQKMYSRWAEANKYKTSLIDESTNEDGGIKSMTIAISGASAYGILKNEHGVHRLVRKSPFNAAASRETSFAMVEVLPFIEEPAEVELSEDDLKIDVYRAGGHGGQSVNTTDSAVRVTHIPTGITVAIQNERSQLQNKETALSILRSKLAQLKLAQHKEKISELKGPNHEAEWGNQIRNYVLHPYKLVKDTRSGYESSAVEAILDGDINDVLEAGLTGGASS